MEQGKTWLCSVLFLDIAGYTQRSVTRQVNAKGYLQVLIEQTVADTPENERVIIDTGDGAALCYMGDPERALFAALQLRESLMRPTEGGGEQVGVRIGINLGPVRFVRSLAGQINPLGDGINNAQRVMAFATPNQILVSRSFYEVIACLSHEYAQLFNYLGVRQDKHVKEHALYEVRAPGQPGVVATLRTTEAIAEQVRATVALRRTAFDSVMLRAAEEALAEYIGPVARVLVKKAAERAQDLADLRRMLAEAVSIPEQQQALLDRIGALQVGEPPVQVAASPGHGKGAVQDGVTGRSAVQGAWTAAELQQAEARLASFVGPLSKILVKRAAAQTNDRKKFYETLAQELDSAADRKAFLEAISH